MCGEGVCVNVCVRSMPLFVTPCVSLRSVMKRDTERDEKRQKDRERHIFGRL